MSSGNSFLLYLACASLVEKAFPGVGGNLLSHSGTVRDTNSSPLFYVCPSLMIATFNLCAMPDTNSTLNRYAGTPLMMAKFLRVRFRFAPCPTQSLSLIACWTHPSWVQRFTRAPCPTQTPSRITPSGHPSWLRPFLFLVFAAPCLIQTPPLCIWVLHPSWAQRLTFAPCLTKKTPRIALLATPVVLVGAK